MANALQDNLRVILGRAVEEAAKSAATSGRSMASNRGKGNSILAAGRSALPGSGGRSVLPRRKGSSDGPLSGTRGMLFGAGAAALAPVAAKGVGKLAKGAALNGLSNVAFKPAKAVEKMGSGVGGAIGDKLSQKVDEAGGASGMIKDAAKSALPFGAYCSSGRLGSAP